MKKSNKQIKLPAKSAGWDLRSTALHASPIFGRYGRGEAKD